tara:strand:- start:326 stop:619 length:294 start_codon:yes stop_codon:yes gene_type:complete
MSVNRARSKKELDKYERDAKYQEELRKFNEIIDRQNKRYEEILKEHNEGRFRRTGSAESPEDYKAHAGRAAKPSEEKPETNKRGIECPPDTPLSKCT